jgi:hypothetical protein
MKHKKHLIIAVSTALTIHSGFAEVITSFQGAVPVEPGWTVGTLPIEVIEEEGKKLLNLKDESAEGTANLLYKIDPVVADKMRHEGFTATITLKQSLSALPLVFRLPNLNSISGSVWRSPSTDLVNVVLWNPSEQKNTGAELPAPDKLTTLKFVFRPNEGTTDVVGTAECFADDQLLLQVPVILPEKGSGGSSIDIGIGNPERMSHTFIESFRLSTP